MHAKNSAGCSSRLPPPYNPARKLPARDIFRQHYGRVNYTYDKTNQLIGETGTVDARNISTTYTYDAAGNRLTQTQDGPTTSYIYNNLNQLIQSSAAQRSIQVKGTVYDANPVTVMVNGIPASVSGNQFICDRVPLNTGSNIIKAEALDTAGNLGSHQITVTYNSATPTITYAYDKNGNLIQRKIGTLAESFTYDCENRLKAYSSPTQGASYAYNGLGKRMSKTVNGLTTQYYYDGNEVILEKTDSSSIYYIHSNRLDEIISDSRGYSYHYDGLGSVVNLTDSNGVKAASYTYQSFGSIRSQTGTVSNSWLFTGRQFDYESGLYFYRNRYYDARVGRFITQDPSLTLNPHTRVIPYLLLNQLSNPLELHRYLYCINNPTNLIDPFGLEGSRATQGSPWSWWSNLVNNDGSIDVTFNAGSGILGVSGQFSITGSGISGYVGAGWGIGWGVSVTGSGSIGNSSGWGLTASLSGGNIYGGAASGSISQGGREASAGLGFGLGAGGSVTVGYEEELISW